MVRNLQSRIYKVQVKSSHSRHEWRQVVGRRLRGLPTSIYFLLPRQYAEMDVVAMLQHVWCGAVMVHQKSCVPPAFLHWLLERAQLAGRNFQERAIAARATLLGLGPVGAGTAAVCSGAPALEEEMAILYKGCRQSIVRLTLEDEEIFLLWTRSLIGCNEITAICNGWNSFGRCLGGGSLEGTATPWQGDELHDLIGVFHL